ncbi:helix-turn-helix transcriptional regulator [Microgenomates group bacterium]|nr:helix-turn-helix transcriptional regulator [Microgenomates group bacterium]
MKDVKKMTTYERFFHENPDQIEIFEKEYNEFVLSELVIEEMEKKKLSVRALAKKSNVSPTIVQKLRSSDCEKVNYRTLQNVMSVLGFHPTFTPKGGAMSNYV